MAVPCPEGFWSRAFVLGLVVGVSFVNDRLRNPNASDVHKQAPHEESPGNGDFSSLGLDGISPRCWSNIKDTARRENFQFLASQRCGLSQPLHPASGQSIVNARPLARRSVLKSKLSSQMGLYDHDNLRAIFGDTAGESSRLARKRVVVAIVCVVVLFLALRIGSRYAFPDRWNALDRVLNHNSVGWAGISWSGVEPARVAALGVPYALEIHSVGKGGPADKAGLLPGDVIVGLNGKPFSGVYELQGTARSFRAGQTITLNIDRAGTAIAVPVTLGTWKEVEQLDITGGISL